MLVINDLIWDDENREHIAHHNVTPEEVEEACSGEHQAVKSYRKRIQKGIYYVITAYCE